MQSELPPTLMLGRVMMRASIQNPVRLPVRLMIVLQQAGRWAVKCIRVLRPHPALYECVCIGGRVVGGRCLEVEAELVME